MADFETTTKVDDCRVWCYCICEIGNEDNIIIGKDISEFMKTLGTLGNCEVYFHNLRFDGQFIIYHLLSNSYTHIENEKKMKDKTFTTLISDLGQFYSIVIKIKKGCKIKIYDSLKKLPFKVKKISKAFNLQESKGEIDYQKERPIGYELDDNEKEYVSNDCIIVSKALNIQFTQGLTAMTIGSDALNSFKSMCQFDELFPKLTQEVDDFIRHSYRGGWVYCNPKYANKTMYDLEVYDVNSLYPSRMRYCKLAYGKEVFFKGEYQEDPEYPLYVQHLYCSFKLKPNCLPMVQIKNNPLYLATEYQTNVTDDIVELYLTNVDLELFKDMYDIYYIDYIDGYKFQGQYDMFNNYIDYWNKIKMENSDGHGDESLRTLAKLMLNNLYGKMASKTRTRRKIPYLDEETGIVKYVTSEEEIKDPIYTINACLITSYARDLIVRSAVNCIDDFLYADTDSLHLLKNPDTQNKIKIDSVKLGYFKCESCPTRGKFLRAKTYIEEINGKLNIKCAGMNDQIKENMTWDQFTYGFESDLKIAPRIVKGGVVLLNTPFTIKEPKCYNKNVKSSNMN